MKSEAMPEDVRRSSTPRADAIPLFQRSGRSDLEDIRYGSRPEQTNSSGDSIITLQPFSDGDVRQGSRRRSDAAYPSAAAQPAQDRQEKKDNKGYFGRMLEKIGLWVPY